jgi:deoxyribodipyrimidine photo-lyase
VTRALGPRFELHGRETLLAPGSVRKADGGMYTVFSHFARAFWRLVPEDESEPAAPDALPRLPSDVATSSVSGARFTAGGGREADVAGAGERAASTRLERFIAEELHDYAARRDRLDGTGGSRMSAHLRAGSISLRRVWERVRRAGAGSEGAAAYLNELVWREFNAHTAAERPDLVGAPFHPGFVAFPWRDDASAWGAWRDGTTGYPIVDAAARQLSHEGTVPNRVRMVAASFLTKHLMIDWRRGAAHYLDRLVDGDEVQNAANWQWVAGSGVGAQPYFRVFNPTLQGRTFDPRGEYVRRQLPELERLPARFVHAPWEAPDEVLAAARVRLGRDYPHPIVEHAVARSRYLEAAAARVGR